MAVIEVGWHGDDGFLHFIVQEFGGVSGELAQDLRADLLRGELLASVAGENLDVSVTALNNLLREKEGGTCGTKVEQGEVQMLLAP